jgi:hypothetical protein
MGLHGLRSPRRVWGWEAGGQTKTLRNICKEEFWLHIGRARIQIGKLVPTRWRLLKPAGRN